MSPNGRRRWRRYTKKYRCRSRREGKTPEATTGQIRKRHQNLRRVALGAPGSVFELPAQPWTPRSLVGASEGAKKRRARQSKALAWAKHHPHLCKDGAWERGRASFRIGQRLRPCPGCCACKSKRVTRKMIKHNHPVYASMLKRGDAWACGKLLVTKATSSLNVIHHGKNHCDGSGLLTATGAARANNNLQTQG